MPTFCRYFNQGQCRSCEWLEQDRARQHEEKERLFREALSFLPPFTLDPFVESPEQGFRNRAKLSVTGTVEAPVIGLLGEELLDDGRELLACPIHHPRLNELIAVMPEQLRRHGLTPYQIKARTGELKGLIAFHSSGSGQTYLRFVLRSKASLAAVRAMVPGLQESFPGLVCVSANIQPVPHAILEGPEEVFLTEKKHIEHRLGALTLKLAPQAFVQTNAHVATALYETAARWIAEARPARAAELFCGQGAFSFFAEKSAGQWLGIEVNADAVNAANETARELGLGHLRFSRADAAKAGAELEEFKPELILVNPPRRGLAEAVALIERQRPAHLIYSSCQVESLARDLKELSRTYRLRRARLFDMFPHTRHFEAMVWLER